MKAATGKAGIRPEGVWLPVVTPFLNGKPDFESLDVLIDHYIGKGISGLIPLGTTGESPTVSGAEFDRVIERVVDRARGRIPVFAGVGGNDTARVAQQAKKAEKSGIQGILSVCPYYNRPDQEGLFSHFLKISESTDLSIIIYNIPYRTGVNLENGTLFRLAECKNIVAVKDSSGNFKQSMDLIRGKPEGFSVMTGEDALFFATLACGGDGGILAAAHLRTEAFVQVFSLVRENDVRSALALWNEFAGDIPLLFQEPNPAPVKYCLSRMGLIRSAEVRLPLTGISGGLKSKLDGAFNPGACKQQDR